MKTAWAILTLSCILAFSTSTGTYLPKRNTIFKDTILTVDTIKADTLALMNIIQPIADSFANEAVKKIDSVASIPRFFVKRVDIEPRLNLSTRAWITIYKKQNGYSQYDTTIIVEIPNQ